MKSILHLLNEINEELGINERIQEQETKVAQVVLEKLNSYLYQEDVDYISQYHRYWESRHKDILNLKININKAKEIALKFDDIFKNIDHYPNLVLSPIINKNELNNRAIANVIFFTAIQDFKINIYKKGRDPFKMYQTNREWYTAS